MTGLSHQTSSLAIREKFALTTEKARRIIADLKNSGVVSGCVVISTCNRTELYAAVADDHDFFPAQVLCHALNVDFTTYQPYLTERTGMNVMEHLCRVASGVDSHIMGDDQIITQVREALELSREQHGADSYLETMFNVAIHAAKAIKTNVLSGTPGASSIPHKTVETLQDRMALSGTKALIIGSGTIGRLIAELLVKENAQVTMTLRSRHPQKARIPDKVATISYDERYTALAQADVVISATTSPHLTLTYNALSALTKRPAIIVDLAVPRDVEPSIQNLPGLTLLTIDDIGAEARLPPQALVAIEGIIAEHIAQFSRWELAKAAPR